jgi:hypothetical protein
VGIVREDHDPAVVDVDVDEEPVVVDVDEVGVGEVEVGEVEEVVDPGSLVDAVMSTLVVEESAAVARGAATLSGARSLTRASAALTICQVTMVTTAVTSTQAPAILTLLIDSLSQEPGLMFSTPCQGFLKGSSVDRARG